jgi:hypothetical protein
MFFFRTTLAFTEDLIFFQVRYSFQSDVLNGNSMSNIVNNKEFWATDEGNTSTQYCNMVVDWWPDE